MSGVFRQVFVDESRHHLLEIPGGQLAQDLRLKELLRELKRLNIEGITGIETKSELLDKLEKHINRVADELRSPNTKKISPLPQNEMRAALAIIAKQAGA